MECFYIKLFDEIPFHYVTFYYVIRNLLHYRNCVTLHQECFYITEIILGYFTGIHLHYVKKIKLYYINR